MLASSGGNIETVRVLLEANADPNITDEVKTHDNY
jgi:ankyrin repeat protein